MAYSSTTPANVKGKIINKPTAMALAIAGTPNYYRRPQLMYVSSSSRTSIIIPANTQVNINDVGYISTSDTTLSCSSLTRAGKDVYVYACAPSDTSSTEPTFVLSLNSTIPSGYTATNSRKIGGFHCLCVSVGTISSHTLSDYVAGDILPLSIWDLLHRPVSSPEGMVWVEGINLWVDIYLTGLNGGNLVSQYGATVADGYSSTPYHAEKFIEELGKIGKRLPWRSEFMVFAKGSNEGTNIYGSYDYGTAGGHKDTSSRRMISNYGIEDCCGFMWGWVNDTAEAMSTSYSSGNYYMSGYSWNNISVYNSSIDSQSYGSCYGLLRRFFVGASWDIGSICGSRALNGSYFGSARSGNIGCFGASEPRVNDSF